MGVALNDVVLRNQQNRDYEAQRIYVNGFEPGTDVWLLLLRAWYEAYSESGVRLGTIPLGKRSVLMLSHDVDWEYSFQPMLAFADFEKSAGTSSTFFVQTKYLDDANSHAFFFGRRWMSCGSWLAARVILKATPSFIPNCSTRCRWEREKNDIPAIRRARPPTMQRRMPQLLRARPA